MSTPSIEAVIAYWTAHDVPYLPGVDENDVTAFETKYDVTLPQDVREFYLITDGTHVPLCNGCDHDMYEFYRLSEIAPDAEFPWAMNFADFQMLSWWFAIDLTGGGGRGPGAVYFMGAIGGRPLIVAHTFTEFLNLYVTTDERLWPDNAKKYHESTGPRSTRRLR